MSPGMFLKPHTEPERNVNADAHLAIGKFDASEGVIHVNANVDADAC
jgi:hypothetical protein